jgi:hypothetical protein
LSSNCDSDPRGGSLRRWWEQGSAPLAGLACVVAGGLFALDVWLPRGVAVPMGYAALVLAALWSPHKGFTLGLAGLGIVLTVLGFFFSPTGTDVATGLINRGLAIGMIAASAALVAQRQKAREEILRLRRFIPMCASCHKIRDDQGFWSALEQYVETHSKVLFSHSLCPPCLHKWYPEFYPEPGSERFGPKPAG